MWSNFWEQARSIFVLQENTLTVVYAKNPISTCAGQSVKINSKKDIIDFIKRFAIPGAWSIIVDAKTGKTHKVMKKGKMMQIPIQSLNSEHFKKYEFDFNEAVYKYFLKDRDLGEIQLVLADGEPFILERDNTKSAEKKKRDKKAQDKEEKKGKEE